MTVKTNNQGLIKKWHVLLEHRTGFDVLGRNLEEAKRDAFMIIKFLNINSLKLAIYKGIYILPNKE